MGSASKKLKGAAIEVKGRVEKEVGRATGSDRLQNQGKTDELEGKARQGMARAEERVKGGLEQAAGAVERKVGAVLGSEATELAGEGRQLKGAARRKANKESGKVGWALLWLLGIPLPVLLVLYVIFHH